MENKSGIHPVGWRILIKPLEVEQKTQSGIIISHGELTDREQMANTTGEVIEIGSESNTWAKVGNRVVFGKFSGLMYVGKDEVKYRVINDDDIVAVLDDDMKLVDPHLKKGL
ncbi:chaperonin 10 kd subunit [Caudoviricetes sp.]|jgi:chaperonin GroES|nr:chaperonin 10 kd subunit [Caudoviricetes sp.]